MRATIVFAGAFLIAASGCLQGSTPSLRDNLADDAFEWDPFWHEHALPYGPEHNHWDPTHHQNRSTANFEVLGWNPLVSDWYGHSRGGTLCGDATDTGTKRYGVVHGISTDVAFYLVDLTDAASPTVVAELAMPYAPTRDVAITPDGRYIVLGTSSPRQPDRPVPPATVGYGLTATWRTACSAAPMPVPLTGSAAASSYLPLHSGAVLVDIRDPRQPAISSYVPLPALGAHSMYANKIGNQYYVLASVVNLVAAVSYVLLLDIQDTAAGPELVAQSVISQNPLDGNAPLLNGHNDGVVSVHPITKRTYAWIANWHQGLLIVDITNPRVPQVVGTWSDNPPGNTALGTNDSGDLHEALPLDTTWDGRHYTFVGQEILGRPTSRPSGYVKALDTTDPRAPKEVASWNLPAEVHWTGSLQFSTHYISRIDRTLFVSHYHAGVWAVDLTGVGTTKELPAVGAFLPANVSPKPRPPNPDGTRPAYAWTPTIMDANALPNGDLVVWDMTSGVYVARFDATSPAPPRVWER